MKMLEDIVDEGEFAIYMSKKLGRLGQVIPRRVNIARWRAWNLDM